MQNINSVLRMLSVAR